MKIQNQPTLPKPRNFSQYTPADQAILSDLYDKGDLRENADVGKVLQEYKNSLNGAPRLESFTGYHSYEEMNAALQDRSLDRNPPATAPMVQPNGENFTADFCHEARQSLLAQHLRHPIDAVPLGDRRQIALDLGVCLAKCRRTRI